MIKFDDGVQFDTRGPLRVVKRHDGYYVVGEGLLIPVDSREEGEQVKKELKGPPGALSRQKGVNV
jgi:hypothetical protein